ncbi:hypothetical protein Y032_0091g2512 [Ancylostoma ceylanicum]|uniref:Uncharacterized protein n=1 Tax=Ancylostoma ceylanicum TaxID=53326 RepID=A0A016TLR2_9BILA|nr:hypothetical protein Y032_0091g2512 [Ancylostoma ceylanicum]
MAHPRPFILRCFTEVSFKFCSNNVYFKGIFRCDPHSAFLPAVLARFSILWKKGVVCFIECGAILDWI